MPFYHMMFIPLQQFSQTKYPCFEEDLNNFQIMSSESPSDPPESNPPSITLSINNGYDRVNSPSNASPTVTIIHQTKPHDVLNRSPSSQQDLQPIIRPFIPREEHFSPKKIFKPMKLVDTTSIEKKDEESPFASSFQQQIILINETCSQEPIKQPMREIRRLRIKKVEEDIQTSFGRRELLRIESEYESCQKQIIKINHGQRQFKNTQLFNQRYCRQMSSIQFRYQHLHQIQKKSNDLNDFINQQIYNGSKIIINQFKIQSNFMEKYLHSCRIRQRDELKRLQKVYSFLNLIITVIPLRSSKIEYLNQNLKSLSFIKQFCFSLDHIGGYQLKIKLQLTKLLLTYYQIDMNQKTEIIYKIRQMIITLPNRLIVYEQNENNEGMILNLHFKQLLGLKYNQKFTQSMFIQYKVKLETLYELLNLGLVQSDILNEISQNKIHKQIKKFILFFLQNERYLRQTINSKSIIEVISLKSTEILRIIDRLEDTL